MKYYLIAGEASGDLHASHLMRELRHIDTQAQFRFIGGEKMASEGGTEVRHYRNMAYMGFLPVLLHLRTILKNMRFVKHDIEAWQPHMLILVDYPGFNLSVAKYIKAHTAIPVTYYIAPKLWAWKEYRIRRLKRDVDYLLSILPFEKDFFEGKHGFPTYYVGNPTHGEVHRFLYSYSESRADFCRRYGLDEQRPIVALLAGSRLQEVKDNLPAMLRASQSQPTAQAVVAGAPAISADYYHSVARKACKCRQQAPKEQEQCSFRLIINDTFALLTHADAALVTSGTATLETAIFHTPQAVCYKTPMPHLMRWIGERVLKVKYVSLVNLILGREAVPELIAERFTHTNLTHWLHLLLHDRSTRLAQQQAYKELGSLLGEHQAAKNAAEFIHNHTTG